jgi:hypothetical protein
MMIAEREVRQGDRITGLVVEGRYGQTLWSGEFSATYGDGKLGHFVFGCDRSAISAFYPVLDDGTVAMLMPYHADPRH